MGKVIKKQIHSIISGILVCFLVFLMGGCSEKTSQTKEIIELTAWTYYNGPQLESFNELVEEFNQTKGQDEGIHVSSYHYGSVVELQEKVIESANGKVGASPMPNIVAAYADTAYTINQLDLLADISPFLSEEEKDLYIEEYLKEGEFEEGEILIFPTAKSTELFLLNYTDWEPFSAATGVTLEDLATMEGVLEVAEKYYKYSGGAAFFGRDAMANYMLIGAMQLGTEIIQVDNGKATINFDHDTIKKLWDYYYIPYVKGYFTSSGRFRSDDLKTGNILCYVGSSSGATYFPNEVVNDDNDGYEIEMKVLNSPIFKNGQHYAVQQGAGMVVTKTTDEEIAASVEFLKWFTEVDRNISFSLGSGYLPVMKEANKMEKIEENQPEMDERIKQILMHALETVNNNTLYTPKAFTNGTKARDILEYSMSDLAVKDRAIVEENIQSGMNEEDAYKEFLSEEHFEAWYNEVKIELEKFADK